MLAGVAVAVLATAIGLLVSGDDSGTYDFLVGICWSISGLLFLFGLIAKALQIGVRSGRDGT
jgi:hypothetical protein